MKLLSKTSLYYVLMSIPLLLLFGFVCYQVITDEVKHSNDELLLNRVHLIEHYLAENESVSIDFLIKTKEATITKTLKNNLRNGSKIIFSDTLILDKSENEMAPNRMISAFVQGEKANFQIKIWRSTIEYDELIEGILYLLVGILATFFLISLVLNFWISKKMWQPFYTAVNNLEGFRASDNRVPIFEKSTTREFAVLNNSLQKMMGKMITDYNSQKKFTENAAHEIQTPLAVIKSKVDLLIQSENLQENEVDLIVAIDDACAKMSRLNKSLLLLTKIENRQFKSTEVVAVAKVVDASLLLFEDSIANKKINLLRNTTTDLLINMNSDLCLVLINNLVQNAIRHNTIGGGITITTSSNEIIVENTGISQALDTSLVFERFHKSIATDASLGLGLAIAHEIAEVSGLSLQYEFVNDRHCFLLRVLQS